MIIDSNQNFNQMKLIRISNHWWMINWRKRKWNFINNKVILYLAAWAKVTQLSQSLPNTSLVQTLPTHISSKYYHNSPCSNNISNLTFHTQLSTNRWLRNTQAQRIKHGSSLNKHSNSMSISLLIESNRRHNINRKWSSIAWHKREWTIISR